MLISYNWLKEFVDISLSPKELGHVLTMKGLEVESVTERGVGLDTIIVGQIKSIVPHPNADKLVLCEVDAGAGVLEIVCGATNMKVGDKVPVALPGTTLAGGKSIKKSKIRGVVSHGMMCSSTELGLGENASGLLILPKDAAVGLQMSALAEFGDALLDITTYANRPDCLSHLGIAREVAAITGAELKIPQVKLSDALPEASSSATVRIDAPDLCPRYIARIIRNVKIGPSPDWMKRRLEAVGLRPINNVVDITNYLLMDLGHPMHVFDLELLAGHTIIVRTAKEGEEIITLDGVLRRLTEQSLVIADAEKPVAIAGIMGGKGTEVSESTCNILLESAYFSPIFIRRTSRNLGLSTESSYRFERGADPEAAALAVDRAAAMMADLACGEVALGRIDIHPRPESRPVISLRTSRVAKLLGLQISPEDIQHYVSRLGFSAERDNNQLRVTVPSHRRDIKREVDLIEEVARLHGYEKIPSTLLGAAKAPKVTDGESFALQRLVKKLFAKYGLTEQITFSFVSEQEQRKCYTDGEPHCSIPDGGPVALLNPLNITQGVMRLSLMPGVLSTIKDNIDNGNKNLRIFELGRVFALGDGARSFEERHSLAIAMVGMAGETHWGTPPRQADFFDLKGILESLFRDLEVNNARFASAAHPSMMPKRTASIEISGNNIGHIGEVHHKVRSAFGIEDSVFFSELDFDRLAPFTKHAAIRYEPFSRFPSSTRDLAVVVEQAVPAGDILLAIRMVGGDLVQDVVMFDLYTGEPVPVGFKSLAFSLTFQSKERTLTDADVDNCHSRILTSLQQMYQAKLR